jgi:predicted acetyltransferase
MADEEMTAEEEAAFEELVQHIAREIAGGTSPNDVVANMVENGWEEDDAREMVGSIAMRMSEAAAAQEESGGGGGGWLLWIGIIIGINVLSYIFNWPFWIY